MQIRPDTTAVATVVCNSDVASGGDAVISIAANADHYRAIDWISWSYEGTPAANAASLTVQNTTDNTTLLKVDITAGGPGQFVFGDRGMFVDKNKAITITIEDGAVQKQLAIQYR